MWYHWYKYTKVTDPFCFRKHCCTHSPTSQLCSSTTYYDSSKLYQMSLDFTALPEQLSAKFKFLQVLLQKKFTKLLTAYNSFSVPMSCRSTQTSEASPVYMAENEAHSPQEPTLPVRAGQLGSHCFWTLYSCDLYCHRTPNITTATQFLFISLLLLSWAVERAFLKALLWWTYHTKSNDSAAVVYEQINLLYFFLSHSFFVFLIYWRTV